MGYLKPHKDDSHLTRKQRQHSLKLAAAIFMSKMGYSPMFEVPVNSHLRADLLCVRKIKKAPFYEFAMVEVKSSVQDFKSDSKWTGYLDYCDQFFFCSDPATIEIIQNAVEEKHPEVGFITTRHLLDINPETAFMMKRSNLHNDNLERTKLLYQIAKSNCLFFQGIYKGINKVNISAMDERYDLSTESDLGGLK